MHGIGKQKAVLLSVIKETLMILPSFPWASANRGGARGKARVQGIPNHGQGVLGDSMCDSFLSLGGRTTVLQQLKLGQPTCTIHNHVMKAKAACRERVVHNWLPHVLVKIQNA